jgi:hypothetical protein
MALSSSLTGGASRLARGVRQPGRKSNRRILLELLSFFQPDPPGDFVPSEN